MKRDIRSYCKAGEAEDIIRMHPITVMILAAAIVWAEERGLPVSVTETLSAKAEDVALRRVSRTHLEGRAFDISMRGWNPEAQKAIVENLDASFAKYGAVNQGGELALCRVHDAGTGLHLHVQIHSCYALPVS